MLRILEEIREHHVDIVVGDRMDGGERAMVTRGTLHKSILSSPVFPISSMGNVVPQLLDITLVYVLTMFSMLVEYIKSQDSASNQPINDESNKKYREKS